MTGQPDRAHEHRTTPAHGEETKGRLVSVGREMFTRLGYSGVVLEDVCSGADVTRGALYHHFPGKDGLFLAVCEDVAADVTASVVAAAQGHSDAWSRLTAGCHAFLEVSTNDDVRQILLTDAPSVLGWSRFRGLDSRHGLGLLKLGLQGAMDEGAVDSGPVDAIAHMLVSALNEAALYVGQADDPMRAREDVTAVLERLLEGIAGSRRP